MHKTLWLFSLLYLLLLGAVTITYTAGIIQDSDDGTEINGVFWYEGGYTSSLNYLGRDQHQRFDVGLRFVLEDLEAGEKATYARLRFPSMGGEIATAANIHIDGVLQESPTTFSQSARPSSKAPRTRSRIDWKIGENWDAGNAALPLYVSSPDVSPVMNEILTLPGWGSGPEGKSVILTLTDDSQPGLVNYVTFYDFNKGISNKKSPAVLEVYKTVYDAFLGKELLGRVTDRSATVNLYALISTDLYIEYGTVPGSYPFRTGIHRNRPAEKAAEITLHDLVPDTRYYYRLAFRKAGLGVFENGKERSFHTQRRKGAFFSFAVMADEHLMSSCKLPENKKNKKRYEKTLKNIGKEKPDFFISLGDFAHPEYHTGRDAANLQEAKERYLLQRSYIDKVAHSIPFYLAIGNHEGEQGWYHGSNNEPSSNLAVFATLARKEIIPNPLPRGFYSGNRDLTAECGLREDYFSWEWGDALFVALAPYWYTRTKPMHSKNGWDWTLGKDQYDWLYETLRGSRARWKFVFIHHLTSTTVSTNHMENPYYGRGGIEVAKHKVDGRPSFEWGGEDEAGSFIFSSKRPGWSHGAVHDLLVGGGVSILFHGHDHFFAKQDLDGIVYQETPQPIDSNSTGYKVTSKYKYGDFLPSSGHLAVQVDPGYVRVSYVRSFLSGEGENGEVAYVYTIEQTPPRLCSMNPQPDAQDVPRNTMIAFELADKESGIDLSGLCVEVTGQPAVEGGLFQPGFAGEITETAAGYEVEIHPLFDFESYEKVNVDLKVSDRANVPNGIFESYAFTTGTHFIGKTEGK